MKTGESGGVPILKRAEKELLVRNDGKHRKHVIPAKAESDVLDWINSVVRWGLLSDSKSEFCVQQALGWRRRGFGFSRNDGVTISPKAVIRCFFRTLLKTGRAAGYAVLCDMMPCPRVFPPRGLIGRRTARHAALRINGGHLNEFSPPHLGGDHALDRIPVSPWVMIPNPLEPLGCASASLSSVLPWIRLSYGVKGRK